MRIDEKEQVFTLILEPVNQCNLRCVYCYSDNTPTETMSLRTLEVAFHRVAHYVKKKSISDVHLLWHGGEPLLAGLEFFGAAAALAATCFSGLVVHHFIQTNGLLLTEEFCLFFLKNDFQVGLSIDGPSEIHNNLRTFPSGEGSHKLVVEKFRLAAENKLGLGCNAVVTRNSLGREHELYHFFQDLATGVRVNPVIPSVFQPQSNPYVLRPGEYGALLCRLFDEWLEMEGERVSVSPLDIYLKAILNSSPQECQHQPTCVGSHLAVKPSGDAVLCSRFTSHILGNVHGNEVGEMFETVFCREIKQRSEMLTACHSCEYWLMCHGGCPHNGLVFYNDHKEKDYFCTDYKRIFRTLCSALDGCTDGKFVRKGS